MTWIAGWCMYELLMFLEKTIQSFTSLCRITSVVKCTNFEKRGKWLALHILAAVSRAPTGNRRVLAPHPSDELNASAPEAKSRSPQSPTLDFSYVLG